MMPDTMYAELEVSVSYFDHVQCSSCGARMNPEQLVPGRGEMPACPHCNANLNLADLFGVKDSFVGMHDNEGNDHNLDDLLGNDLYDSRYASGRAPAPTHPPPQRAQRTSPGGAALRRLTSGKSAPAPPAAQKNALVPRAKKTSDSGGAPSALDLLREMKKR